MRAVLPTKPPNRKARPAADAGRRLPRPQRLRPVARPREPQHMTAVEAPSAVTAPDRRAVVTALGVTQILAWGSTFYLLGVLANPIAHDTGWGYEWVMAGVSAGLLVAGMVSPRVGRAIAEHGGRPVLAASAVLLAAGLALLGSSQNVLWYLA